MSGSRRRVLRPVAHRGAPTRLARVCGPFLSRTGLNAASCRPCLSGGMGVWGVGACGRMTHGETETWIRCFRVGVVATMHLQQQREPARGEIGVFQARLSRDATCSQQESKNSRGETTEKSVILDKDLNEIPLRPNVKTIYADLFQSRLHSNQTCARAERRFQR